jgi:hypothetical protein
MQKAKIIIVLGAGILFGITVALFFQSKAVEAKRVHDQEVKRKVAAALRQEGYDDLFKIPVRDVYRMGRLGTQLRKTRKISDSDLRWLLAFLKPRSEPILQSKVLGILHMMGSGTPSQKEMIKTAVKPLAAQNNPRYRISLQRVQKFVFGNPDWQPGQPF